MTDGIFHSVLLIILFLCFTKTGERFMELVDAKAQSYFLTKTVHKITEVNDGKL